MKRIIYSLSTRYLVNVIMIAAFGVSAATGLINPGGHRGRPHGVNTEQVEPAYKVLQAGYTGRSEIVAFKKTELSGEDGNENIHVYFGLAWLALMIFHTIHHWNWFKKMFSVAHIKKNKLLVLTVIIFLIMAVSGLMMWTETVPREVINMKEIHEFTGQTLLGLLLIHLIQRIKWYIIVPSRILKRKTILA